MTQFKKPVAGKKAVDIVVSAMRTPKVEVKFSGVITPYYYNNDKSKNPTYSITLTIDAEKDSEFVDKMLSIFKKEKAPVLFKKELKKDESGSPIETGKMLLKFKTTPEIGIFSVDKTGYTSKVELASEISWGTDVELVFDVIKYLNRDTQTPAVYLKASSIYIHEKDQQIEDEYMPPVTEECPF